MFVAVTVQIYTSRQGGEHRDSSLARSVAPVCACGFTEKNYFDGEEEGNDNSILPPKKRARKNRTTRRTETVRCVYIPVERRRGSFFFYCCSIDCETGRRAKRRQPHTSTGDKNNKPCHPPPPPRGAAEDIERAGSDPARRLPRNYCTPCNTNLLLYLCALAAARLRCLGLPSNTPAPCCGYAHSEAAMLACLLAGLPGCPSRRR